MLQYKSIARVPSMYLISIEVWVKSTRFSKRVMFLTSGYISPWWLFLHFGHAESLGILKVRSWSPVVHSGYSCHLEWEGFMRHRDFMRPKAERNRYADPCSWNIAQVCHMRLLLYQIRCHYSRHSASHLNLPEYIGWSRNAARRNRREAAPLHHNGIDDKYVNFLFMLQTYTHHSRTSSTGCNGNFLIFY